MAIDNITIWQVILWFALIYSLITSFYIFREMADLTQFIFQSDRKLTMWVWYNRYLLSGTSVLALFTAAVIWVTNPTLMAWYLFGWLCIASITMLYGGLINPQLMFRSKQHNSEFISVDQAKRYIKPKESVIVLEINGDARAYTDRYLLQPHIADTDQVGGEDVVMTYCGLTHLGIAYTPEISGKRFNLKVMNQLENNLIMWDTNTGEPIQQITGRMERDNNQTTMKEWPTFRMAFQAFAEVFPNGRVFYNEITPIHRNPLLWLWDTAVRMLMTMGIIRQEKYEKPAFPTIKVFDDRLPTKAQIYGFNVGDDYVAYTAKFVQQAGEIINTVVGGRKIVVKWNSSMRSLTAFFNDSNDIITEVDIHGNTPNGKLQRVNTLKSGAYWFVWYHFFPSTDINRPNRTQY